MSALPRRSLAFTFIELLSVVVLLALAASVGAVAVAGASDSARIRSAAAMLRGLDSRARLSAQTGGPVVIESSDDGRIVSVRREHDVLSRIKLPDGVRVCLADPEGVRVVHAVRIGSHGRCGDYGFVLRHGEIVSRWTVNGATGWVTGSWEAAP